MYVKSMVIEGFKSYGQRTEIKDFDRQFNAITGLNGSGKSNILDAICFVLGITNLTHVRAGSLQELVYKSGQAGVTKASVTITFDNRDTSKSPLGYEKYDEITVTRQTVVAGKNRYIINGVTVQNKRVNDLFNSVQLNVNNPHFLIMQGRITKVLNMKPPEILSMIEEAAGTRMYETKKQQAEKTIEKKDAKLKELNDLINEEIGPKLARLKEERGQYLELQKVQRELEHLTKISIAWNFMRLEEACNNQELELEETVQTLDGTKKKIEDSNKEMSDIDGKIEELRQIRDAETGGKLADLEKELSEREKEEAKAVAKMKSGKENVASEEKKKKQLEKSLKDDEAALKEKEKVLSKAEDVFLRLRQADEEDSKALEAAQRKYQAVSSGLLSSDDGQDATLQDQLMNAKQEVSRLQTESMQCNMQLEHNRNELKTKQKDLKQGETDYARDEKQLQSMDKELESLRRDLGKVNYEEGKIEELEDRKRQLNTDIRKMRDKVEQFQARNSALRFNYRDPEPNFDRSAVKGLVCQLFKVKDPKFAMALESAAGGRLYNVVVDNEMTSNKIIKKGQLQKRVTFIPINKIQGSSIDQRTIQTAQSLVGPDKCWPALSLISYDRLYQPVMEWIFGQVFVCDQMSTASKVTYHNSIRKKCITLDGDVTDPGGTLSGGAPKSGGSVLMQIVEFTESQKTLSQLEAEYANIDQQIRIISKDADKYNSLKQRLEIRQAEVEMVRTRIQQTAHHQLRTEVNQLQASLDELSKRVSECKEKEKEFAKKVKELEAKVKDAKNLREKELKAAEQEMKRLQKKAEESRNQWKEREQEFETSKLEIEELKKSIENGQQEIEKCVATIEQLKKELEELTEQANQAKTEVKELQKQVKDQKDVLSKQNSEIQATQKHKASLEKEVSEMQLQVIELQHKITKLKSDSGSTKDKLNDFLKAYEWIETDRQFFGQPDGMYDFKASDPHEAQKRLARLKETKEKLSRTVNARAVNLLGKEEEQYNEVMRKKGIVEKDKQKIVDLIKELDEKKKEALRLAWKQVNKDFGSIFGSLLPGAQAALKPPSGRDILEGLEVKVGFNGIWKESLGELSGGQRSLVALSLILAMLLFKPAPIYILDEVDAALDLSHTQNIGQMLKAHFKHSQFIIVSLKDGMFNNANVLFRTQFVDGMSTVSRTTLNEKRS
ncbi:structural maintenance of chromosomes protein 2 [Macrosteles quadrilineatus]|uniref:structural maintenance of chromosomes protein 2 n=1 Tax=Macrosteles quadrilineatus TaxID=74068 RepID=UPI0023E19DE6|nr:structural maintenance of chromosomes protein 2 [Macrosteles quadrilineatus]